MAVPAVLLASICMPMASADELPGRRIKVRPRPAIQQVGAEEDTAAAADRWKKLKEKYAENAEATEAKPPAKIASRPDRSGVIRRIPEVEELEAAIDALVGDDWANQETDRESMFKYRTSTSLSKPVPKEPLPITGFEQPPDWVLGGNADLLEELTEGDDASHAAPPQLSALPSQDADGKTSAPEPATPTEPEDTPTPSGTDPGYTPMPSGSRRPRQIRDISPSYDLEIDRDIRDFAKEQAKEYGLEFGKGVYEPRAFQGMAYLWEPSNFWHYPLYFEDPQLERYGHTYGPVVQPMASIARFGGQLLMLPYQMTLDPICCPKYALGWYRPGECAPYLHYQVPLNAQAAAVEAAVVTGFFFLIP